MDSILQVTTPATDLTLLSIEELREAADVSDRSQDDELRRFGLRVAARIAAACRLRRGGAVPATLRQETLLETFRVRSRSDGVPLGGHVDFYAHRGHSRLRLARRPIVSLDGLFFDGVSQDVSSTTILIDADAGFIEYLPGKGRFYGLSIGVAYKAGWDTIPEDLKLAARMLLQQYIDMDRNETNLMQENVPGVLERRWQVAKQTDADVPQSILDMLGPYRNED